MAGSRRGAVHQRQAWAAWLVGLCAALAAGPATALEGTGSNGILLGENSRAHPYVYLDTHYVTNPGRLYGAAVANDVLTVARLGVDGSLKHTAWDLNWILNGGYNKYWGLTVAGTRQLSAATGSFHLDADINKNGSLELKLSDDLQRTDDVANQAFTRRLLHWTNTANGVAEWTPGGGALVVTLGYGFFYDTYDHEPTVNPFPRGALDNWRHLPRLRMAWKFLPKTALFIEGEGQLTYFKDVPYAGTAITNVNSRMVQATAGLLGNVTRKITTQLKAGYGNTLLAEPGAHDKSTVVGLFEVAYAPTETSKLAAGFARSLQPTSMFRYFLTDRPYIKYEQQVADHTQIAVSPEYNIMDFGLPVIAALQPAGTPNRRDKDFILNVNLTQALSEWLTVSIIERLNYRVSNFVTSAGPAGYFFNDVYLRIDVRY